MRKGRIKNTGLEIGANHFRASRGETDYRVSLIVASPSRTTRYYYLPKYTRGFRRGIIDIVYYTPFRTPDSCDVYSIFAGRIRQWTRVVILFYPRRLVFGHEVVFEHENTTRRSFSYYYYNVINVTRARTLTRKCLFLVAYHCIRAERTKTFTLHHRH